MYCVDAQGPNFFGVDKPRYELSCIRRPSATLDKDHFRILVHGLSAEFQGVEIQKRQARQYFGRSDLFTLDGYQNDKTGEMADHREDTLVVFRHDLYSTMSIATHWNERVTDRCTTSNFGAGTFYDKIDKFRRFELHFFAL